MSIATRESVAKVILVNEKNEALILTVGEYKARPDKSYKPDLPGGLVDPGESELIAVQRELVEEAGITLDYSAFDLAFARTDYYEDRHLSVSKFLYVAKVNETPEVTISWEHASYTWVSLSDKLEAIELRPFYRDAVNYAFKIGLLSTK